MYSFAIQGIAQKFRNYFLENLISVTYIYIFGIHFAIVSGWSVDKFSLGKCQPEARHWQSAFESSLPRSPILSQHDLHAGFCILSRTDMFSTT